MARALDLHSRGQGFDSLILHRVVLLVFWPVPVRKKRMRKGESEKKREKSKAVTVERKTKNTTTKRSF